MSDFIQSSIANINIVRQLTATLGNGLKKSLGQNFLVNQKTLFRFINSLKLEPTDIVVEIGPGIGVVSYSLAQQCKHLYLIEIDQDKEPALNKVLENFQNFTIKWEDASQTNFVELFETIRTQFPGSDIKVIGSLPYNVGKRIIYNLLTSEAGFKCASFFLQKEVAESYSSKTPQMDFLAAFASIYAQTEYLFNIPPEHFIPKPKVNSGVLHLKAHTKYAGLNKQKLGKFIKQGFVQPRKTILNNLKPLGIVSADFKKAGINEQFRAGQMSIENWVALFQVYASKEA